MSSLLSPEVPQGDLLHRVGLALLLISSLLPLARHGTLNTLNGREKSHNRNIQTRSDRELEVTLLYQKKSDYGHEPPFGGRGQG